MVYDVIIAGAGPVGLFLACELRLAKLSVLVLEQSEDPHSPLKRLPFGMRGLWGPERRSLLPARTAGTDCAATSCRRWCPWPADAWIDGVQRHNGAVQPATSRASSSTTANIDSSRWTYRLPGPADTQFGAEMEHLERVLAAHALSLGVELRRGQGVDGFEPANDATEELIVRSGEQRFRARWLVGCDGGRSTVRKLGSFEFVGTDPEFTGYSVRVELADPSALPLGRHYTPIGMYTQWQPGVFGLVDFDGGAFHRTQPITLEHVQAVLRRVSGADVTLKVLSLASTWTDRSHQATTYRKGRVLLAGDAAHIHSPLGGQGLNLGLGDAMNLGWEAGCNHPRRRPRWPARQLHHGATSDRGAHPRLDASPGRGDAPQPTCPARLEAILRDLIDTRDGATYFAERVWGVSLRYDLGDEHPNGHPLVGRSCPDFELEDGTRIGTRLQEGNGLLLDFGGRASLQALDGRWGDQVRYVATDAKDSPWIERAARTSGWVRSLGERYDPQPRGRRASGGEMVREPRTPSVAMMVTASWPCRARAVSRRRRRSRQSRGCPAAVSENDIHTHMCYSVDADVLSIETSRSKMELFHDFGRTAYPNEVGPGVYDIHAPRVPTTEEMDDLLARAGRVLPIERLWVNPDCGSKTRGWPEVRAALTDMVESARRARRSLVSGTR